MSKDRKVKWQGFVNVSLTRTEKTAIKEKPLNDSQCIEFIVRATELGYKFSATFSGDGEFYTVTLYGSEADNPNAGYAMSMRHRDIMIAISAFDHVLGFEGMTEKWDDRFDTVGSNDW